VCTIHRAQNIITKEPLADSIEAFNEINNTMPVILPLHPHTKKRMDEFNLKTGFKTTRPLSYPQMKALIQNARYVITDSGGTAREAFFARKKSITLMPQPFWPEIIDAGCSKICVPKKENIINTFPELPALTPDFEKPVFGNGDAAKRIADDLLQS